MFRPAVCVAVVSVLLISISAGRGTANAEDPEYYVKKGTWQETMQASREALVVHLKKPGAPKVPAKPQFGPWFEIGPYSGGDAFHEAYLPEKEIDLSKGDGNRKCVRDAIPEEGQPQRFYRLIYP